MVTQVRFTRGWLDGDRGSSQKIVRTMHATLGRGFLVLLNGHIYSIFKFTAPCLSDLSIQRKEKPSPSDGLHRATHNCRDAALAEDRE